MRRLAPLSVALIWAGCVEPGATPAARAALSGTDSGPACKTVTYLGCCLEQTLVYCAGGALVVKPCGAGKQCGWSTLYGMYVCGSSASVEPSGKYPRTCQSDLGLPAADLLPPAPDGPAPDSQAGCGPLSYVGCCAGTTIHYCVGSKVLSLDCSAKPSCGWNDKSGFYDCGTGGTPEPSGKHLMSCSALLGDSGLQLDATTADLGLDGPQADLAGDLTDAAAPDIISPADSSSQESPREAGSEPDGLVGLDASGLDVSGLDAGLVKPSGGGGCDGCTVSGWRADEIPVGLLLLAVVALGWRRRCGRC